MEAIVECPVCKGKILSPYLSCEDYTVSHETFQLKKCNQCDFVFTSPRPDSKELGEYYLSDSYISHSDKSLNLVDQVYKLSRKFTLRWKYNLVKKHSNISAQTLILDFGCGTGAFLQECQRNNAVVSGVEPSGIARKIAGQNTNAYVASDIKEIRQQFDVITLWHVLEHVEKLNETVQILKSLLKKNGTLFIAVPNLQSLDARTYRNHWAAYDGPRHLWHFSRSTMQKVLTKHELKLINVVPMKLDAYYVSLLSEKYKNGETTISTLLQAIRQGWKSNHAARKTQEYSSLIYIARHELT